MRAAARLMDDAVELPLVGRVGLDPLLGLVPGLGDLVAAAVSIWIVAMAVRMGVPAAVAVRMLINVAIDALVGTVPLLGDIFDVAFKANRRNLEILEEHLEPSP